MYFDNMAMKAIIVLICLALLLLLRGANGAQHHVMPGIGINMCGLQSPLESNNGGGSSIKMANFIGSLAA